MPMRLPHLSNCCRCVQYSSCSWCQWLDAAEDVCMCFKRAQGVAQLTGGAGAMTVANAVTRNLDSHEHGTALAAHA